jgi:two-component system sensor kinase FixL
VETLPHGIAEVDRDGRFTFVNTAYLRLRGLEPSDIIGRLAWETSPLPEEADRLRQFYRHVSTYQPEPKPYFTRTLNRDNKTIELRIDWSYRRASGRELTGFIACVTDVTEQQRAERDARQRLSDLAHVGRLSVVGEMLSGLAHEIRQPLSAIVNEGQACRHLLDGPREVVRESLDQIVNQAVRATQIVRSLRDFTRRGEAKRQAEDLGRLLRDVLRLLEFDASSFSVKLRLDVSDDLPPVWVDAIQIEQVVVNLVRNAMEAIEEARSAERIVTIRARHSGEDVVVEVEDTGPGLSEEVAARLFESYFTTKTVGMGLGLPISRTIIEDHGGGLEAVTGKTPGAVFRFTLPLA